VDPAAAAARRCGVSAVVTGGTGFLGWSLLRLLLEGGQVRLREEEALAGELPVAPGASPYRSSGAPAVRALVRSAAGEVAMRELGVEPVRGDLTRADGCAGLVRPGDVVYHAAARVELAGARAEFQRTTVEGTRNLLRAVLPERPRRFVYVSSAAVYSPRDAARGLRADRMRSAPSRYNYYARAKLAAEELVKEECARAGCEWVIVRLGFLYGPGNRALLKHMAPLLAARRLWIIGRGDNRIATCYVEDAARAVLLAGAQPGAAGRVYDVASDERVTQRQFVEATADAVGEPRPASGVPVSVAFAAARVEETWAWLRGRVPAYTRAMVALMAADQVVDAGVTRAELGWRPTVCFVDGMKEVRRWWQAEIQHGGRETHHGDMEIRRR